jgi:uncharacterized membrane protein HdeD (DUF308 family)
MSVKDFSGNPLATATEEIRSSWGWFLVLGILFIVIGVIAIIGDVTATFVTVVVFGWFLLISGVFALIHGLRTHTWKGFLLSLLSALLRGFTGYLLIRYPLSGAAAITLILASFFIVSGLFRAIGASMVQLPSWGWTVFSGIVSFLLGVTLLYQMPGSSIWFIGFAIGIDLIVDGASLIGLGTAIHHIAQPVVYKAA